MPKQRKTGKALPNNSSASVKADALPNLADRPERFVGIAVHLVIFLAAFLIVISRRPDAVLNAQFFAEDGVVWYPDAYNFGLHSLLMPQASYLHTLTRLIALSAQPFPLRLAPLVMNLGAITFQILPVNLLLSSRFSQIGLRTRLLASFVYLALPNSYEVHANITTIQWHLTLLAVLVLLAQPAAGLAWRIFDGIVLVLISVDGPTVFVLLPLAAGLWWKRRQVWDAASFVLLVPGAVIQGINVLLSWHSRQVAPNGPTLARFISILGRQVFVPSILGLHTASALAPGDTPSILELVATSIGLALLLYVLFRGPVGLKLYILFAFAVFMLCLARPLAGPPERAQWDWLCVPGVGNRYYFLPMLAFLAVLLWIAAGTAAPRMLRYLVVTLLLLMPIGIFQDWLYPPFKDFHFQDYAAQFEHAAPGTPITIPINPDWKMELTKR